MRLLFVADPLARLNPKKDSTVALMRAAARLGDEVFFAEAADLSVDENGAAVAAKKLNIRESDAWHEELESAVFRGAELDCVFMRMEPPVDSRFAAATLMLDALDAPVYNAPRALREWNEKLAIMPFASRPPTLVSASAEAIAAFHARLGGAVVKPLDGMGGRGVYVSPPNDMNLRSVLEMQGAGGAWLMAQEYLPEAREGDARVFVIDGKAADTMLLRRPRADDHRGNMAAGGAAEAIPLSAAARAVADEVGPSLSAAGVLFAGVDVIGGRLTEINITCPTGLCEVRAQTGVDLAESVLAAARARLQK